MSPNTQRRQEDNGPPADTPSGDHSPEVMPARRAQQGVKLGRMRYVLLFGILLTVLAFAIGYLAF